MAMEHQGTGRVRLSDYYKGWDDPEWHFIENVEYLRALGALDDSDPANPSVIIPNLLISPANCVTSSDFYSVCCFNECEALVGSLEASAEGPTATPERIAKVVSELPSATVDAPRSLHQVHLDRLEVIARTHGGQVPLHGRLFAQWMHHAYPRECPYPHVAGTTSPTAVHDWIATIGDIEASSEVMREHVAAGNITKGQQAAAPFEAVVETLPWDQVEEFPWRPSSPARRGNTVVRGIFFVVFVASALQGARVMLQPQQGEKKHWV